jgi:hypothetical protein
MAPATLATLATRGGGPPFAKFGAHVQYVWADALAWPQKRTSKTVHSTSELQAVRDYTRSHEARRFRPLKVTNLIDIRTWHSADGKLVPGKGLAVGVKHLPRLAAALTNAVAKATELRLIDSGDNDDEGSAQ